MRRRIRSTLKTISNSLARSASHRATALLLLAVFIAGTVAPPASVYAAATMPKKRNVAPIAEQKANYETIPQVGQLDPVNDALKTQTPSFNTERKQFDIKNVKKAAERKKERSLQSTTYDLEGGGQLTESTPMAQNYRTKSGELKPINTKPERDSAYETKHKVAENLWQRVMPGSDQPVGYKAVEGSLEVYFETIGMGGIRIVKDGQELQFAPDTDNIVKPQLKEFDNGDPYILYQDVWPSVDLYYAYQGTSVKEYVRIKKQTSQSSFAFNLKGATVSKGADGKPVFDGPFADLLALGDLGINVNKQGPVQDGDPAYTVQNNGHALAITVDGKWLSKQQKDAFPIVVDPAIWDYTYIPGGYTGDFKSYKSDGYYCSPYNCNVNIGGLYQSGAGPRYWRAMVRVPYEHVMGRQLLGAWLDMSMTNAAGWAGYYENRTVWATWAPCFGYGCTNGGAPHVSGTIGGSGTIDVTPVVSWLKDRNIQGGWLILWGEEWHTTSYKQIHPQSVRLTTATNLYPSQPAPEKPSTNPGAEAVVVTPTPQLRVSPSYDPNGDTVEYYANVIASNGAVVWGSGWSTSRQWVLPDGILQDGSSYRWEYYVRDPWYQSPAYNGGSFRLDLRTNKDKSQTYDTVGPVNVSLNTGNIHSSTSTHSMSALGGNIGLQLDYNSPVASRRGLHAQYYNNTSWSGNPAYSRFEENIEYDWNTGSPAWGVVGADNFTVKWSGYFVAPYTGNFTFGSTNDDYVRIDVDSQTRLEADCCRTSLWSGSPVSLREGQIVKLDVWFREAVGPAYEYLLVKSDKDSTERVVPADWLRTAATATGATSGLTGHYYIDDGSHDPSRLTKFMTRTDSRVDFSWPDTAPAPGAPGDNFMVRWEGYFTAPTTGSYYFGGGGDDGYRVYANNQVVTENWAAHGYLESYASAPIFLTAGQSIPIKMDFFELGSWATARLLMNGPNGVGVIDSRYLSPNKKALPTGWNISADIDGNLLYERLKVRQNGDVTLYDGDGTEHLYTTTGTGYKPPVNENGILARNNDYSYTLTAEDGRTYVFNKDGELQETTTPPDDRKPAALEYKYTTRNGMPTLDKIVDRVNPSRYGSLIYGDSGQCTTPDGFDPVPSNYLCAFVTSDGQRTDFLYRGERLVRVAQPGNANYDLGYDSNGMLASVRDTLANDAIAAGVRTDDATAKTELTYDILSRLDKITAPAPTAGANRSSHQLTYLATATKTSQSGTTEPKGYSQYIEYDNLLRTTKVCDNLALCTLTEWDPTRDLELSSTDPAGLKRTTIYDDEQRVTDTYGPAPAAWFGSDRRPLSAYVSQIPHNENKYDEGIVGTSVAWYNVKGSSLFGSPKLHTTGINPTVDKTWQGRDFRQGVPITPDEGMDGYGFSATGKIRFPGNGTYSFRVWHDDGVRLWVDDRLVIDNWGYRSEGITQASPAGTFVAQASKSYRYRFDYIHFGTPGALEMWTAGPGITDTNNGLGTSRPTFITPAYNLETSSKVYDSTFGDVATTIGYGSNPELGIARDTTIDPTGLNLTTSSTFEEPNTAGSFLRQTSKTLPGSQSANPSFSYSHYGATETRDNPCTPDTTEAYKQAGFTKLKTEADPDGTGPLTGRTTETVYNDAGKAVASRINQDDWTCTTYDARGRTVETVYPTVSGKQGRTVKTNYAYMGSPLITYVEDSIAGNTLNEVDLLGRSIRSVDTFGAETTITYNADGQTAEINSPLGKEEFAYDDYGRTTQRKLDDVVYATVTYDSYSNIASVTYPQAQNEAGQKLALTTSLDDLGRAKTNTYTFSDGKSYADTVTRSQSGKIANVNTTYDGKTVTSAFSYDKADRLTRATIDNWVFDYAFGTPDATCANYPGANMQAGKNGNRTQLVITDTASSTSTTTNYCYDQADRLSYASNTQIGTPTYDDHGNTTRFDGAGEPITFTYDALNNNTAITQGENKTEFVKSTNGSILLKRQYKAGELTKIYRYLAGGKVVEECSTTNQALCGTTTKTLSLPGDVTLNLQPNETDSLKKVTYTVKNYHGDSAVTVDATGAALGSAALYDPFGSVLKSATLHEDSDYMVSQSTDFTLNIKQYGARTYVAELGRFLQVDPIDGGTENAYVYVNDPINDNDYEGTFSLKKLVKNVVSSVVNKTKQVVQQVKTAAAIAVKAVVAVVQKAANGVKQAATAATRTIAKVATAVKTAATNAVNTVANSTLPARILVAAAVPSPMGVVLSLAMNKAGAPTTSDLVNIGKGIVAYVRENPADAASLVPIVGVVFDIYTTVRDCGVKRDGLGCGMSAIGFVPFVGDIAKGSGKVAKWCAKACSEYSQVLKLSDDVKNAQTLETTETAMKGLRSASHASYDINKLSAKSNGLISPDRMKHIIDGNDTGGAHFLHSNSSMSITSATRTPDANGVTEARIMVNGSEKLSTFYPANYTADDVVNAIKVAWNNKSPVAGDPAAFIGTNFDGVKIRIIVDNDGLIKTAYPIYKAE